MLLQYGDVASILALPAPTPAANGDITGRKSPMTVDRFASLEVAPPRYVQMNDMENKQTLLMEEQMMWDQYNVNGRQGHMNFMQTQQQHFQVQYSMGHYSYTPHY